MKQQLREYLEDLIFKSELSINDDSLILSKKEFIFEAQGSFENDDKNLWVKVEGIDCNVPYEAEEKYPFENSDKFDNMGMEDAMADETFDELYRIYLEEKLG